MKLLLLTCLLAITSLHCFAQETAYTPHPLAIKDSLVLKRYLDSVNVAGVYSMKRQRYLDSALSIKPWNAHWWQQKGMPLFKEKKYELGLPYLDSG